MGKKALQTGGKLLHVSLEDIVFMNLYKRLSPIKKPILKGQLEKYIGAAKEKAKINIDYARSVI
jgi:hypothetical protein